MGGGGWRGEQRDVTSGPALSSPSYRMLDLVMVMLRGVYLHKRRAVGPLSPRKQ